MTRGSTIEGLFHISVLYIRSVAFTKCAVFAPRLEQVKRTTASEQLRIVRVESFTPLASPAASGSRVRVSLCTDLISWRLVGTHHERRRTTSRRHTMHHRDAKRPKVGQTHKDRKETHTITIYSVCELSLVIDVFRTKVIDLRLKDRMGKRRRRLLDLV